MSDIGPKHLGRAIVRTRKRPLSLPLAIIFSVAFFAVGFVGMAFPPAVDQIDRSQQSSQKNSSEVQRTKSGTKSNGEVSQSQTYLYLGGAGCVLLGVICGAAAWYFCAWEVQIRERGLLYQCRRQMHAMYWSDITSLNVYLNSRPMPTYHVESRRSKKKIVFWLHEVDDKKMIELLDTNVPDIAYWTNRNQRADIGV